MKHEIKTLYFHENSSFHMQGKNFGGRVDTASKAKICYDDETKEIHIYYNGKMSSMSSLSVKNWDYVTAPSELLKYFEVAPMEESAPEVVKRGRGRPPLNKPLEEPFVAPAHVPVNMPPYDPNDPEQAAHHRALVRAASANAYKPDMTSMQNDTMIQEARNAAMGVKSNRMTAQVATAQQVGQQAAVMGKPKAISHAGMKAQVEKEMKS